MLTVAYTNKQHQTHARTELYSYVSTVNTYFPSLIKSWNTLAAVFLIAHCISYKVFKRDACLTKIAWLTTT